jgi:hypothetical protein
MPESEQAFFGNQIIKTDYVPIEGYRLSPGISRNAVEIRSLERMAARWRQGNASLRAAIERTPEKKLEEAGRLLGLNEFIVHMIQTAIHVKRWWQLKQKLFNEADPRLAERVLDELVKLAEEEIANAEAAIAHVEADSRLGWEPSMEYMTDPERIRWKIAQTRILLTTTIPNYRKSLALTETPCTILIKQS